MRSWLGVALVAAGLLVGFVVGRSTGLEAERPPDSDGLRRERDAAIARAERAETELAMAREARRRPRDGTGDVPGPDASHAEATNPAASLATKAPATHRPADDAALAETRLANARTALKLLRADIEQSKSAKEGEGLLRLLAQAAKLAGDLPEARDDAMKLAIDIYRDVNGPGELRLPQFTFYTALGDPAIRDLMTWSLENHGSSIGEFRVLSVWSLPWMLRSEDAIARFERVLSGDPDRAVQNAAVANLASMNTPSAHTVLARVFADTARDAPLRGQAAFALASSRDEAVVRAIENAADGDPDPQVRASAKAALVARNPPADGLLVTATAPDGTADAVGLRAGDIIVSYAGAPTPDTAALSRTIQSVGAVETVPMVVLRDGREQTFTVKPGRLGVYGRPVRKK